MAVRGSQRHTDLEAIQQAIVALDRRLTALEQINRGRDSFSADGLSDAQDRGDQAFSGLNPIENESRPRLASTSTAFVLAGRAFLAFGGAFVLRALTESRTVGPTTGVWLGIAYALAWLVVAVWSRGPTRLVNGWLTLAIGLPLVLEAVGRFRLLSPAAGLAAFALVAGLSLLLAWRYSLASLAAGAAFAGAIAGLGLGFSTGRVLPFAAINVLLAIGALWMAWHRDWRWLAWLSAGVANLGVLVAAARALVRPPTESPIGAEALLAVFGAVYIGSFVLRTLLHERSVHGFEVAQTTAVLLLGFGGAIVIARANGLSLLAIGVPAALAGAGLYAQSFLRVAARRGYGGDFQYYGFLAFSLVLAGATVLLPGWMLPAVTSAAALVLALLATKLGQTPLMLQSAMALIVAAVESGLLQLIVSSWTARLDAWPPIGWAPIGVLTVAAVCYAAPSVTRLERNTFSISARTILGSIVAASLACALLLAVGPLMAGRPPSDGTLATARMVILTVSVVLVARLGRAAAWRELAWIAYAGLAFGGLKMLFEDLPRSRASTLFIALAAYGVALILTPRVMRNRS